VCAHEENCTVLNWTTRKYTVCAVAIAWLAGGVASAGQEARQKAVVSQPSPAAHGASNAPATTETTSAVSADYVIGPSDVLGIVFWGDREMSSDVVVRPDGKISLPLLNDIVAAGFTPETLRVRITEAATRLVRDPVVTVVVRQVNNNNAFITGNVQKPGPYALAKDTTVLHLIALSGGLLEFADKSHIVVMRSEGGRTTSYDFNYADVMKRKNVAQNIVLRPGDTVIVP
jgi:polysaccharide biosynthesis/export protein